MSKGKTRDQELESLVMAYIRLFETPNGVDVLADLKERCMAERRTFDSDPYKTAFNEGRRSIWLEILQMRDVRKLDLQKTANKEGR